MRICKFNQLIRALVFGCAMLAMTNIAVAQTPTPAPTPPPGDPTRPPGQETLPDSALGQGRRRGQELLRSRESLKAVLGQFKRVRLLVGRLGELIDLVRHHHANGATR